MILRRLIAVAGAALLLDCGLPVTSKAQSPPVTPRKLNFSSAFPASTTIYDNFK